MQDIKSLVSVSRRVGIFTGLVAGTVLFSAPVTAASIADAARQGQFESVLEFVTAGTDVNEPAPDGTTALLWATYQNDVEMVQALLAAGADVDAANDFGITPVLQAARTGDAVILEQLLNAGADASITHPSGETALMSAARSGSVAAVTLLLDVGVDPNAFENLQHQTALMWAAVEGHVDVVGTLLDAGANPDMQARVTELTRRAPARADFPSGGFTALMFAARNGDEAMVRRLVAGGADLNIANADGATPMMIAIVNDRFDFAVKMLELGADANDGSLYQAVLMRDAPTDWLAKDGTQWRADYPNELDALGLTRVLLEAGADPNKPFVTQLHHTAMCCDTKENATPMFRAAVASDVAALELLLEYGGDLNWFPEAEGEEAGLGPQTSGRTALMVAMYGGRGIGMAGGPGDVRDGKPAPFREQANRSPADAVALLIAAGADPNAVTPKGDAALHLASKDGKIDVIRALVDGGADMDLPNAEGETALVIVEAMEPREEGPQFGGAADYASKAAQPAEVAELLRELMANRDAQASLAEESQQ